LLGSQDQLSCESSCATAGGAGDVSVAVVATDAPGVAVRSVQVRAFVQLEAWFAAAPAQGHRELVLNQRRSPGDPSMWRPVAVITNEPL
jgi:hypothetical protein